MTETLHVACAARVDYLPHSATMLHSVLSGMTVRTVRAYLLHGDDVGADLRADLAGMVERMGGVIDFLEVSPERVEGLTTVEDPSRPHAPVLPASHWYRVFLPELLPDVDRLLYLDGDIIAVDSLDPLWETDLDGNCLGAVTNVFEPWNAVRATQLGLSGPGDYFNSGVLLMDLAQMRRTGTTEAVLKYGLANAEHLAWPEQDALNVVLGDRRLPLHPRWNCMNAVLNFDWSVDVFGEAMVNEAREHPAIRHFEGPKMNKPWHYMCDPESRELYAEHRRGTPWPEFRPDGATLRNRLSRLVRR